MLKNIDNLRISKSARIARRAVKSEKSKGNRRRSKREITSLMIRL